jgi:hypothetical protein
MQGELARRNKVLATTGRQKISVHSRDQKVTLVTQYGKPVLLNSHYHLGVRATKFLGAQRELVKPIVLPGVAVPNF